MTTGSLSSRTTWHITAGAVVAGWLLGAVVVGARGLLTSVDPWLPVHLLLLGAVSNAILVWGTYFTEALLRLPRSTTRTVEAVRLALFDLGALAVVLGMVLDAQPALMLGAGLVVVAAAWHGAVLVRRIQRSLPSRFGSTVRYYVAASALLPLGVCLGVVMASHDLDDETHARVALAHVALNVLGWMGLTVLGTLVTLWPTMLHTRMAVDAERVGRQALPVLAAAVVATAILALVGNQVLVALGLAGYVAGIAIAARPLVAVAIRRPPSTFPTWSVGLGLLWLVATISTLALVVALSPSWAAAADTADRLAAPLLVGFGAQVLLGALSYLAPVVLGGGPAASRATIALLGIGARTRLVLLNVGVLAGLVPLPSALRTALWLGALAAMAAFLPLLVRAALSRRTRTPRPAAPS